jgi:hypothetical protein
MPKRNYSSTVIARRLTSAMSASSSGTADVMILDSTATVPTAYPFTMVIDPDTNSEEIVTVTAAPTGYSYPVTRGSDGTTATAHLNNSVVRHMVTARDLQEPQDHIYASADVHGLATAGPSSTTGGSVVGTLAQQALTNKTISASTLSGTITASAATINAPNISGSTISGTTTNTGTLSGGSVSPSNISLLSGSLSLGTNSSAIVSNGLTIGASNIGHLYNSSSNIQIQLNGKLATPTSWDTTWVPTWGGTSANAAGATVTTGYVQVGKTINFRISITYGTGNFGSTGITFTTPSGLAPVANAVGQCISITGAGNRYGGEVLINTSGFIIPLATPATAGGASQNITSSIPFAWGTTAQLIISGTYEVA